MLLELQKLYAAMPCQTFEMTVDAAGFSHGKNEASHIGEDFIMAVGYDPW